MATTGGLKYKAKLFKRTPFRLMQDMRRNVRNGITPMTHEFRGLSMFPPTYGFQMHPNKGAKPIRDLGDQRPLGLMLKAVKKYPRLGIDVVPGVDYSYVRHPLQKFAERAIELADEYGQSSLEAFRNASFELEESEKMQLLESKVASAQAFDYGVPDMSAWEESNIDIWKSNIGVALREQKLYQTRVFKERLTELVKSYMEVGQLIKPHDLTSISPHLTPDHLERFLSEHPQYKVQFHPLALMKYPENMPATQLIALGFGEILHIADQKNSGETLRLSAVKAAGSSMRNPNSRPSTRSKSDEAGDPMAGKTRKQRRRLQELALKQKSTGYKPKKRK